MVKNLEVGECLSYQAPTALLHFLHITFKYPLNNLQIILTNTEMQKKINEFQTKFVYFLIDFISKSIQFKQNNLQISIDFR